MYLMAVDHFPDTAGCRPVRHALKHQRCRAVGKRPIDNIAMASDPAHIGRTPVNLAPSVIKAPFMRQARPEQIPPRCMEDALRLARRAGGIEDEQRLLCIHGCRFALSIHLRRQFMIPMIAASLHRYITAGNRKSVVKGTSVSVSVD